MDPDKIPLGINWPSAAALAWTVQFWVGMGMWIA